MMKDIRGKAEQFLTSEVGRVSVRGPLALGVASGAFMLSQMMHTPPAEAFVQCASDADCDSGEKCEPICVEWDDGTCTDIEFACVDIDS